ncbi:hypothetical protein [Gemmatimonas sp.]|uniref:hypothetical protein n=1 Tax=Gemmatimonas sp. TaxID=1962908 RepID=UPI00356ADB71
MLVYATEIGYGYDGGEYWQTFARETPHWAQNGNRNALRQQFERFASDRGGFRPTGDWARTFSIISWPISHAILPRVYQRQLAQLLYELRTRLTRDLLADPIQLGQFIAAHSWEASERFQQQASNHAVIGQVARSLLVADLPDEDTGLLESTVRRIASDLSQTRDARRWLEAAQHQSRTAFATGRTSSSQRAGNAREPQVSLDPVVHLRKVMDRWSVHVRLPDFRQAAESQPELLDALSTKRVSVAGAKSLLARRALLFAGADPQLTLEIPLGKPLLTFEGSNDTLDGLLAPHCRFPNGPLLFRIQEGEGVLVKGRHVRPGCLYVLLSSEDNHDRGVSWITGREQVADLFSRELLVPERLAPEDILTLSNLGLSAQTTIRLEPVGLTNFGWDGEDVAAWPENQEVAFAVVSDRRLSSLIVSTNAGAFRVELEEQQPLFSLGRPVVGRFQIRVEAFESDDTPAVANTKFDVEVKRPQRRSTSGSLREAIALHLVPPAPRFTEIQNGEVGLEITGPTNVRIKLRFELHQRGSSETLAVLTNSVRLPVDERRGKAILSATLRDDTFGRQLERADLLTVSAEHPDLGVVSTTVEREFVPLRWIMSGGQDEISAYLVDNVDDRLPTVRFYSAQTPDVCEDVEYHPEVAVGIEKAGLLLAEIDDIHAAIVIMPTRLLNLADLGGHGADARLVQQRATSARLQELVQLASTWRSATKPRFDASLTTRSVLRAVAAEIGASIGGKDWARVEHEHRGRGRCPTERIHAAIGTSRNAQLARTALLRRLPTPSSVELPDLTRTFSSICGSLVAGTPGAAMPLGEFCLRLASAPSTLADLSDSEFQLLANEVIANPVIIRLARSLVFAIDRDQEVDVNSDTAYGGLVWT